MRQAFAWSLVGVVLVAALLACPLPAGAGDPDIPQSHAHFSRPVTAPSQTPADTEVHRTDPRPDSRSTVVESPAPRITTMWEMLARWMIANAIRAGH